MSTPSHLSTKIDADDISLAGILDRQKFTIDYFQREYRWEEKHMAQLLDDLSTAFLANYSVDHERHDVESYNGYYMGPVVMSNKDGQLSIIDGQQRLTSLTLLLIYLHNRQKNLDAAEPVDTLIFSEKYGKKTYNMQVPEREACLDALYNTGIYEYDGDDESVNNLVERYENIEASLAEEIDDAALPFFVSWLKERLVFVKIVTYSEENAYTIFETMNDRGLNLTPTEMLKGYLLSKVKDPMRKNQLNAEWKKRITELHEWSDDEDLEFFKAWFRAKFADTIRPGKKGASNEDFEKIGTTFHTWLKDKHTRLGLEKEKDFVDFVENKVDFYSRLYIKANNFQYVENKTGLERLYNLGWLRVAESLSMPLLLAPIVEKDRDEIQNVKLQLVAHYLECLMVYRSVNQRTTGQSSLRYTIFSLVKELRDKSVRQITTILKKRVLEIEEGLEGIEFFSLNQQNKKFVRYFLARITQYIENACGLHTTIDHYLSYSTETGTKPVEIEHIWADNFTRHKDEFDQKTDFQFYRNTLGGLILLPRGTNQSFNKDTYEKKLPHYLKQNLLAQSLHPDCYQKNPNFTKTYRALKLAFKPHTEFKKADLEERTALYRSIAEKIWSVDVFDEIAAGVD